VFLQGFLFALSIFKLKTYFCPKFKNAQKRVQLKRRKSVLLVELKTKITITYPTFAEKSP
jgi:hypothetical protein